MAAIAFTASSMIASQCRLSHHGAASRPESSRHSFAFSSDLLLPVRPLTKQMRSALADDSTVLPSGEWPENFSILNFEDLSKHYESILFKDEAQPSTFLADVMSKTIYTARPDQLLEEIDHFFSQISGLPVINEDLKCIGVLSKKDKAKASNGLKSKVGEVMSSPPITLSADKTVSDAAVLMLKNKIHRIPVVNGANQVVGIVTRTDIFSALEGKSLEKEMITG